MGTFVSTDTSPIQYYWRYNQYFLRQVAVRQTDRQMPGKTYSYWRR